MTPDSDSDFEEIEEIDESEFTYQGYGCKICGQKTSGKKNYCIDHIEEHQTYVKEISAIIAARTAEERDAERAWEIFKTTHQVPQLVEGIFVKEIIKYLVLHKESLATLTLIKENLDTTHAAMHGLLEYLKNKKILESIMTPGKTEVNYRLTYLGKQQAQTVLRMAS